MLLQMNLKAYKPKVLTEVLLLLISKSNGNFIQQTQTNTKETLEFNKTKSRESFFFDTTSQLENAGWM